MRLTKNITVIKMKEKEIPFKEKNHDFFLSHVSGIKEFRDQLTERLRYFSINKSLFYLKGSWGVGKSYEISKNLSNGHPHTPPPFWFNGKTQQLKIFPHTFQKHPTYLPCVLDDCHYLEKKDLRNFLAWLLYQGVKIFVISENDAKGHGENFYQTVIQAQHNHSLMIPPLILRLMDLKTQLNYFATKFGLKLDSQEESLLMQHNWLGNSLELRDTCYHLSLLSTLERHHHLRRGKPFPINLIYKNWLNEGLDFYLNIYGLQKTQEILEQEIIAWQCSRVKSLKKASLYLKIPPSTLNSKIKKHQIIL